MYSGSLFGPPTPSERTVTVINGSGANEIKAKRELKKLISNSDKGKGVIKTKKK